MSRAAFRQADVERLLRAAGREGAAVQVDLRTLVVTLIPGIHKGKPVDTAQQQGGILHTGDGARYGKENWDED